MQTIPWDNAPDLVQIYVDTVHFVCAVDEQDVMYIVREWWEYVKTKSLVNIYIKYTIYIDTGCNL